MPATPGGRKGLEVRTLIDGLRVGGRQTENALPQTQPLYFTCKSDCPCPCNNETLETCEHIIIHCQRYERHRDILREANEELSLPEILGTPNGIDALCEFLRQSGAFSRTELEAKDKEWSQLEDQLFQRWELLAVFFSKNGDRKVLPGFSFSFISVHAPSLAPLAPILRPS